MACGVARGRRTEMDFGYNQRFGTALAPTTNQTDFIWWPLVYCELVEDEETRRCKAGGPSRIRQMGKSSPKRRQEDGRVRVLRILRERKARPSRFPPRRQQMANRSPLASSRRSIERLTQRKFILKFPQFLRKFCVKFLDEQTEEEARFRKGWLRVVGAAHSAQPTRGPEECAH